MGRFLGLVTNDPQRLRCVLGSVADATRKADDVVVAGWGLGFHQGDEVLLRKSRITDTEASVDLRDLVQDIDAGDFLGNLQRLDEGVEWRYENAQPFRYRQWLFVHQGDLPGFPGNREALLAKVPEFLKRPLKGTTDSEVLFHVFLSRLHAAGILSDLVVAPDAAAAAAAETVALARACSEGAGGTPGLNLLATDGRLLIATASGHPLFIQTLTGIAACPVCRLPLADDTSRPVVHPDVKAVVIASGMAHGAPGWEPVDEGHVVHATRSSQVGLVPL